MEALEATVRIIEALSRIEGGGPLGVLGTSGLDHFKQIFPEVFDVIYDAARDASFKDVLDRPG